MTRFLNFRYLAICLVLFFAVQKGIISEHAAVPTIIFFVILTMFKDMLYKPKNENPEIQRRYRDHDGLIYPPLGLLVDTYWEK